MRLFLIGVLATLFSFAPKTTSVEPKQSLTVAGYNITLSNPTGWYLMVLVNPQSSTGAVTLQFTADLHEPNGTVYSGLVFVFINIPYATHVGTPPSYEYQKVIPVNQSGYPAGSYVTGVRSVGASVYNPF